MPGLVVRVQVEVGQAVAGGTRVVVLEAMKMENELKTRRARPDRPGGSGRPGQAVEKGQVLVEFEPRGPLTELRRRPVSCESVSIWACCHRCFGSDHARGCLTMKTFTATPADISHDWYIVDADGMVLGRLATESRSSSAASTSRSSRRTWTAATSSS